MATFVGCGTTNFPLTAVGGRGAGIWGFVKAASGFKLLPVVVVVVVVVYEFGGVVGRGRSGASFLSIFFLLLSSVFCCKASMLKK